MYTYRGGKQEGGRAFGSTRVGPVRQHHPRRSRPRDPPSAARGRPQVERRHRPRGRRLPAHRAPAPGPHPAWRRGLRDRPRQPCCDRLPHRRHPEPARLGPRCARGRRGDLGAGTRLLRGLYDRVLRHPGGGFSARQRPPVPLRHRGHHADRRGRVGRDVPGHAHREVQLQVGGEALGSTDETPTGDPGEYAVRRLARESAASRGAEP